MAERIRLYSEVNRYYANYRFDSLIARVLNLELTSGRPEDNFNRLFAARENVLTTEVGMLVFLATQGNTSSLLSIMRSEHSSVGSFIRPISEPSQKYLPRLFMTAIAVQDEINEQRKRNHYPISPLSSEKEHTLAESYRERSIREYKAWELRKILKIGLTKDRA